MKKAVAAVLAAAVLAVGVWAAVHFVRRGAEANVPAFPPRPEDMALEFWICDNVTETDWSGHEEIPGWMGAREYLGRGYHTGPEGERPTLRVSYILTAWPDYADEGLYVTTIEITDPAVSVYGLTVDSAPEEFERVMRAKGYEVVSMDNLQTAVMGEFTFSLLRGDLPTLCISAAVTNREGIVF